MNSVTRIARRIARRVNPLLANAASAPAALDIRASVGTSTSPTSTGTKAVTGVGFQPKVVLPFGVANAADGAGTTLSMSTGAMTGAAQALASVVSRNGVTTSNTRRRHSAGAAIEHLGTDGIVYWSGARSALGADGFTLDWSASASAVILNHICLGGADLEVSLTQQQMNGTNAAQSFAHGLSGAPTGILFFGVVEAIAPPVTSTSLYLSVGAWANNNQQFAARVTSLANLTTSQTFRALHTNGVAGWLNMSGAQRTMAVNSVDATSVNVTYPVTTSNYQEVFWMLAIRGAKCQVGTFDCNGSTSPLTIATNGITPKLFLPVFVPDGVDNLGSVRNDLSLTIGASDGTNNVSCGIVDQNAVTTTNTRRWQSSTSLSEWTFLGTRSSESTAAFSGESVILTPTTNAGSVWAQGGYLVIGS